MCFVSFFSVLHVIPVIMHIFVSLNIKCKYNYEKGKELLILYTGVEEMDNGYVFTICGNSVHSTNSRSYSRCLRL